MIPNWITITNFTGTGTFWKLTELWYRPTGDPDNDGTTNVRLIAYHKDGKPAFEAKAVQRNGGTTILNFEKNGSGQAQASFNMSGDSNFNPSRGEVGPYSASVQGRSDIVAGMGLPLKQHEQYWLIYNEAENKPPETLEQAVQNVAVTNKPWLPINTDAALYKFAEKSKLGYPQTNEWEFEWNGTTYIGQVFSGGICYVPKGQWDKCAWVVKP
jgi:hypothetical protein